MNILKDITNTLRTDYKVLLFCAIFFSLLLFVISPDSPTHDLYGRNDTAWFFMCGKAWMNGMIPYVDFADSKGPLLWLIFGIGYLISPTNYFGLYILSCILYTFIGYLIYKILILYVDDKRKGIVGVTIMSIPLFLSWFHYEIRAEDYAMFFSILSLYVTVRKIKENSEREYSCKKLGFVLGACFSCSLLIKFNIAAMQLYFLFYLLYKFVKLRDFFQVIKLCKWYLIGVTAIILPFLLYFIMHGNLAAFIQEYFINTTKTVSYENPIKIYIAEWLYMLIDPKRISVFIGTVLFLWLYVKETDQNKYFPLLGFLFYYGIAIHHAYCWYYLSITVFFLIYACLYLLKRVDGKSSLSLSLMILGCFIFACYFNVMREDTIAVREHFIHHSSLEKANYNYFSSLISQKKNPTLIIIGMDDGVGTASNALPGCKYWSTQNGATEEMLQEQRKSILEGNADFIYIERTRKNKMLYLTYDEIKNNGYKLVGKCGVKSLFRRK